MSLDGKDRVAVWTALVMAFLALIFGIAGVSVGGKHAKSIDQLKKPDVLLSHDAASRRGDLQYAGSLFRGSGFWAKRKDLTVAMADFGTVSHNDLIYIVGGVSGNGTVFKTLRVFDPLLHNLTELEAPMASPRYRFGIAVVGSKIYVVGGKQSDPTPPLNSLSIYDIATNTWEEGPSASVNRSDLCAASLNGKLYAVGGYDSNYNPLGTVEEYDPETKIWRTLSDLPTPRGDLMCAALNSTGLVYALGGYFDTKADSFSNKVEAFDPTKNTWVGVTDLLTPRGDAVALVLPGDRIMVIGGEGHYRKNDMLKYPKHVNEIFYPEQARWVEKAMIPTARFRLGGAVAGGLAYALGGADLCAIANYSQLCPVLATVEVFLDVDHPDIFTFVKKQDARPSPVYPL